MEHQSQASVPPAPALSLTMASLESYSSERRVLRRISSSFSVNSSNSASISGTRDSSCSSFAISIRIPISSYDFSRSLNPSIAPLRLFNSPIALVDFSTSSQNPGSSMMASVSSMRRCLPSRSRDFLMRTMVLSQSASAVFILSNSTIAT